MPILKIIVYLHDNPIIILVLLKMIAVITGDIMHSRSVNANVWLNSLKSVLNNYGCEPKEWEIYRGDSFQLMIAAEKAIEICFHIKSAIKTIKTLDVRLAVGVGEIEFSGEKITESNGSAFINSGECFENLKKNTIAIKTSSEDFDKIYNLVLQIYSSIADNWSTVSAEIIKYSLENPEFNQNQIAEKLNKSQSSISESLKRGGYDELTNIFNIYKDNIRKI